MTKRKHMNRAAATQMNVRVLLFLFNFSPPTHAVPSYKDTLLVIPRS